MINRNVLLNIMTLERNILEKNIVENKSPRFSIAEQLNSGFIKVFLENNILNYDSNHILLKISGIWESTEEYGLTFKFIVTSHQL